MMVRSALPTEEDRMVEFVKISENGALLKIKEVSDIYRSRLFRWDKDE